MLPHSPQYRARAKILTIAIIAFCSAAVSQAATVNIHPGEDIPSVVAASPAGTTFVIYPGTYRLTEPIIPKNGDSFIGQTACAPPKTSCPAILTGSSIIGPLAKFNGTNYEVTGQTQQGRVGVVVGTEVLCDPGWEGCIYPEDLFFDDVPYQHLYSSTLPAIGSHQWWFDYTNHIIYFHDNPSGHTVETSVLPNAFGGIANNVTIQYLTVKEFASMFPDGTIGVDEASPQTQGANWTVENCEVLLNHGYGVRVGYGVHILNNYLHNGGNLGIGGGLGTELGDSRIVIQGNTINYNDYAHWSPNFGSGGIKIGDTAGITIRGNTIQHNEGSGVHLDDNTQGVLLDGNTVTDNFDSDGVNQEMGSGVSTFRNNIVQRNGAQIYDTHFTGQMTVHASPGVNMYCNVLEVSEGPGINGWIIGASDRGDNKYPPYQYLATTGNSVHYNTVIWDAGAIGGAGFMQNDDAHQPNFFTTNARPDFNTYHMSGSMPVLMYDNNNSQKNARKTFPEYQSAGADVHGSADTNYKSGFPVVAITSPADQSSFSSSVTVEATASDKSGINRVEFYADWTLLKTVAGPPYNFTWTNATTGSHTVAAMAYSNAGIRNCYAVTLNKQ